MSRRSTRAGAPSVSISLIGRQISSYDPGSMQPQVEALERDDAVAEQRHVSVVVADREVVDADQPDPVLEHERRRRSPSSRTKSWVNSSRSQSREFGVFRITRSAPVGNPRRRQGLAVDRLAGIGDLDDRAAAEHRLEREGVDAGAVVVEVQRPVDVGAASELPSSVG